MKGLRFLCVMSFLLVGACAAEIEGEAPSYRLVQAPAGGQTECFDVIDEGLDCEDADPRRIDSADPALSEACECQCLDGAVDCERALGL